MGDGGPGYLICDSQVHAPDVPYGGHVGGLSGETLLKEMDAAGVDRCVVVPPVAPGPDVSSNNEPALELARANPDRLAVMGRFNLTLRDNRDLLAHWKDTDGMFGIRVSFVRDPNRRLLVDRELEWFWREAESAQIPTMLLLPTDLLGYAGEVAAAHPGLAIAIDHFGLTPYLVYVDPAIGVEPVLDLARYPNVSVKATALPDSTSDAFPFPSLHAAIRRVVDEFGPRRVFWGSDLTRLSCPYEEVVRLFTECLPFLSRDDKEWIMGRAVMEWLSWD